MSKVLVLLISHRGRHVATGNRGARDILNIHTFSNSIISIADLPSPCTPLSWLLVNTLCGALNLSQARTLVRLQGCALFDRRTTAVLDYPGRDAVHHKVVGEDPTSHASATVPSIPTLRSKLRSMCLKMVRDTHRRHPGSLADRLAP